MLINYPLVRHVLPLIFLQQCVLPVASSPLRRRANPVFPNPNFDPFYSAPDNLSDYQVGEVIRSRPAEVDVSQVGASAFQVYYRTSDWQNTPTGTVTTVWSPLIPDFPPKIVHYAFAEDADNIACAPSWAFITNSGSGAQPAEREILGPILIPWALSNGYHVVLSDAEGPDSTFFLGVNEGRFALDGLRAAINFHDLTADETDIAIIGYSGGAHTAVWTSELAASYAPELGIKGAAFGGTPIDPRATFEHADNTTNALVVLAALLGLAAGYPDLGNSVNEYMNAEGRGLEANLQSSYTCTQCPGAPPLDIESLFTDGSAFLSSQPLTTILRNESLLSNVSTLDIPVPMFPRLEYHGTADEIVPYWTEAAYVQQQCARGADIRFVPFPSATHEEAALEGLVGALLFVQQALTGTIPPNLFCGSASAEMPLIGSIEASLILGTVLAELSVTLTADALS